MDSFYTNTFIVTFEHVFNGNRSHFPGLQVTATVCLCQFPATHNTVSSRTGFLGRDNKQDNLAMNMVYVLVVTKAV
jgi:hypothetical protein